MVVAIPTKKEKFSQCKALLFIIIITNEKRTVCVLIESRGKSDDFKDEEGLLYATRYLIEVKQQRSEFSFAFLHDFQNCTSNDVDDAFTSSVPKKNFSLPRSFKRIAQCVIKPFLRKATYDQLIGIHWQIIHWVGEIFRKLASIPFMLRRLSFLSTGFSTRCDDANEKS